MQKVVNRMMLAVMLAAGPLTALSMAAESERVVNVSMADQFGSRRATSQMKGDVVVLVYAERHGAEASRDLGRALHVHFHPNAAKVPLQQSAAQPVTVPAGWPEGVETPDVKVVAVACLSEVPRMFHGLARSRFRSDSPHLPVWLDFTDTMKKVASAALSSPKFLYRYEPEGDRVDLFALASELSFFLWVKRHIVNMRLMPGKFVEFFAGVRLPHTHHQIVTHRGSQPTVRTDCNCAGPSLMCLNRTNWFRLARLHQPPKQSTVVTRRNECLSAIGKCESSYPRLNRKGNLLLCNCIKAPDAVIFAATEDVLS